jgi:hypothetical protein
MLTRVQPIKTFAPALVGEACEPSLEHIDRQLYPLLPCDVNGICELSDV